MNKDMPYVDAVTHISGKVKTLQAIANKVANEVKRTSKRRLQKEAAEAKRQNKLKRKVQYVFQDPEIIEEKVASHKSLDHIDGGPC